jgi:hypothetical protein
MIVLWLEFNDRSTVRDIQITFSHAVMNSVWEEQFDCSFPSIPAAAENVRI